MVDRRGPGSFEVHADTVERVSRALGRDGRPAPIALARRVITAAAHETARTTRAAQSSLATPALQGDTPADARARARLHFNIPDNVWAIGVVGTAGAGKSTLINWLRRLAKGDPKAAAVGITSSTTEPKPYVLNENVAGRVQLWDTQALSSSQSSFPFHLMAAFDVVMLVVGDRLTECARNAILMATWYQQRLIFVRSKLDLHLSSYQWDHSVSEADAFARLCLQWRDEFAERVLPHAPDALCFVYSARMMDDEETRSRMLYALMPPKGEAKPKPVG